MNQRLAALRFFYIQALKKASGVAETPYPKKTFRLPTILSQEEVAQLIAMLRRSRHQPEVNPEDITDAVFDVKKVAQRTDELQTDGAKYRSWSKARVDARKVLAPSRRNRWFSRD